MDLVVKFEKGYSADAIIIGNVVEYYQQDDGNYLVVYKDKGELWDIVLKHVEEIKEVVA